MAHEAAEIRRCDLLRVTAQTRTARESAANSPSVFRVHAVAQLVQRTADRIFR